ncbi:leucyl-tRNA synthetase, partial [Schistosoma bovis]
VRRGLYSTVDWLHEHACSRTYGLGTRLPWDDKWLIESLSDSTIYMAYYTIAHLLQGGSLDGRKPGPLKIWPEHMTPEVWDYIFLGIGNPEDLVETKSHSSLSVPILKRLRQEFLFWYPVDLRMSKSTGNFLTLADAVEKYSADGKLSGLLLLLLLLLLEIYYFLNFNKSVRLALADAGDSLDDANIKEEMAEAGLLRLYGLLDWFNMTLEILNDSSLQQKSGYRTGAYTMHADFVFENEMNNTIELADKAYASHEYREVLKIVFYELQAQILEIMAANLSDDGKTLADNATLAQLLRPHLKAMGKMAKRAMPFVQLVRERFVIHGKRVLQLQLEVDECEVIKKNLSYLISTLGLRQPDGLKAHRDRYREVCQGSVHTNLIRRYMNIQLLLLSPICSHVCEHIWINLLNNKTSIFCEKWPELSCPVDRILLLQGRYIDDAAHTFRLQLKQYQSSKSFKSSKSVGSHSVTQFIPPSDAVVWVAKAYPAWQAQILEIMAANLSDDGKTLADNATLAQLLRPHLKAMGKMAKRAMPFVQLVRERFVIHGKRVLQLQLEVDECEVIKKNLSYLISTLGLRQPDGLKINYSCDSNDSRIEESVCPLEPLILFCEPSTSASMTFLNPDIGSGLFTLNGVTIFDGDTYTDVVSRVVTHCRSLALNSKDLKNITLYRFTDPTCGHLRVPPYPKEALQIVQPTARFVVDASSIITLKIGSDFIPIGKKLVYTTTVSS